MQVYRCTCEKRNVHYPFNFIPPVTFSVSEGERNAICPNFANRVAWIFRARTLRSLSYKKMLHFIPSSLMFFTLTSAASNNSGRALRIFNFATIIPGVKKKPRIKKKVEKQLLISNRTRYKNSLFNSLCSETIWNLLFEFILIFHTLSQP